MSTDAIDEFSLWKSLYAHREIFADLQQWAGNEFRRQKYLRERFPDDLVRLALQLHDSRSKASSKFSQAAEMWFDRREMEQATAELVARHKAQRFEGQVWDLCCGCGGDALALAEHCQVQAVDIRTAACLRVGWNAEIYGVADSLQTVCADVEQLDLKDQLAHIDPDRRASGQRRVRIEDGRPDFEFLQSLMRTARGGAIKLSPASNFLGKFPQAELELISLHGECKEATVWFGELANPGAWKATVLPAGQSISGDPLSAMSGLSPLDRFVFDPDPSIVRSGLLEMLATQADVSRLDEAEEYLTGRQDPQSPFLQAFEVVAELPNNDKMIRKYFREADYGQVEIKCRHLPINAETVRRKLPLNGNRAATLIFARVAGRAKAIVCHRQPRTTAD